MINFVCASIAVHVRVSLAPSTGFFIQATFFCLAAVKLQISSTWTRFAMRMTLTALPVTSAGRFSPLGPVGIASPTCIEYRTRQWKECFADWQCALFIEFVSDARAGTVPLVDPENISINIVDGGQRHTSRPSSLSDLNSKSLI